MKALHLIPYMHPSTGGPPVVVDAWSRGVTEAGGEAVVLTTDAFSTPDESGDWATAYNSNYELQVFRHSGPGGFGFSPELRRSFQEMMHRFDIVHIHNLWNYCTLLASRYCSQHNVPFVISSHGMMDPHSMSRKAWKKKLYAKLVEWRCVSRAAGVLFTHREEERLARSVCPSIRAGYVVPLGTEQPPEESRSELRERFISCFPETRSPFIVMFLSRLHSKKGLDLLIPAFARVHEAEPESKLVLVGPVEASYAAELRGLADRSGVAEAVVMTGPVSGIDKWAALAAANVYVLPSYQENFAIAMVEALRLGCPVICSRRVNLWSDLQNAGAASVCDLNSESVAEEILALLQDPGRAEMQGEKGAAFASGNFTWKRSTELLLDVYARVIAGDGPDFAVPH